MKYTDDQRKHDDQENREKFRRDMAQVELDRQNLVKAAYEQGWKLGYSIGEIEVYPLRLNLPQTPPDELANLSLGELESLAAALRQRIDPGK